MASTYISAAREEFGLDRTDWSISISKICLFLFLYPEQILTMIKKCIGQKRRASRVFLKETILIPIFLLIFVGVLYLMIMSSTTPPDTTVYEKHSLPPLSTTGAWAVFNGSSLGAGNGVHTAYDLYYSPNNHPGVTNLINALVEKYPTLKPIGASNAGEIYSMYEHNIFSTYGALQFNLSAEQWSTGLLVTSQIAPSFVDYTILINPSVSSIPSANYDFVLNNWPCAADAWWSSGYLTLQNFVAVYLAKEYEDVPSNYDVETFVQRYPKSHDYFDTQPFFNASGWDWYFWRWLAGPILSICLFMPMLGLLTEVVRERQYKMKDLLEISGLMPISYWSSYLLMIIAICQITIWVCTLLLQAYGIFDSYRIAPYVSLMTCYTMSMAAFSFAFGFLVDRSEYYGLPIFLLNTILAVCGEYVGKAYSMSYSAKLFLGFLCPPIGFTNGIFAIETFMYHNQKTPMDWTYADPMKHYPSLQTTNGMLGFSMLVYLFIAWGMPFDWIFTKSSPEYERVDEVEFPCDHEEIEAAAIAGKGDVLLNVNELSHIYPDGTHAVKNISFKVREGEVLSFLGANGAGKSTCMGMLCGTLDASIGDAVVNGHSISNERTVARRNLGICFQQDVIWNDVTVEDHLMLFGRLRGLHFSKLRQDVARMLTSLGFPEKRASLAGTLSGGQKRRLCVGISMIGGNSVVYLDEPTAGLDPVSRRQLWELVQRNREGRAILLTTHFMDEADVLGDRIAIVKEGRLRALGTSKFLKRRFGLGYLLRMSLAEGTDTAPILALVTTFAPQATVASNAGTELSLRLPKEAVETFALLFETLDAQLKPLNIKSYGIETTTLEEVFMRIINEDTQLLLTNHEEANRMLGASPEERRAAEDALVAREEARNPLPQEDFNALLNKSNNRYLLFFTQVISLYGKRIRQFVRSRGQWSFGLLVPVLVAVAAGALLNAMPTAVLGPSTPPVDIVYDSTFATPVAAYSQQAALSYTSQLFGGPSAQDIKYIGNNYTILFDYINEIANAAYGPSSSQAIAYQGITNFTVMYNASYPINFAAAVEDLLNTAVNNVTKNLLFVENNVQSMAPQVLGDQEGSAFLIGMLMALFGGSLGAGLSIVLGAERVQQVKHQQLASGASKTAYWLANFLFDSSLFFIVVLIYLGILAAYTPTYAGAAYGTSLLGGFFFIIGSVFRFYVFSFWIDDVKLAQTLYFYGSLASFFVCWLLMIILLFTAFKGNFTAANGIFGYLFSVVDPPFAFFLILLIQHNLFGILTQNEGKTAQQMANPEFVGLVISCMLYFVLLYGLDCFSCSFSSGVGGSRAKAFGGSPVLPDSQAEEEEPEFVVTDDLVSLERVHRAPPARQRGMLDPDVQSERVKVSRIAETRNLNKNQNAIFIHNLRKVYFGRGSVPTKVAVKDVSVTIPHGEVFGLLGANGAGKTTLLKMVSGQENPSSGRALIDGYDVVRNRTRAQRSMGLCPQFDTLVERLSVRENIVFFGKLKGLTGRLLQETTEAFMLAMNIKRYENKLIQQLSGGNRRKVSLVVALIGAPPTVYLDEPSTGLDPVASRLMWRLLAKIATLKTTAIVLTTHNMLECEAVCTRVCIMKLGEMVCLGDTQHLRSVHGTGFLLDISLADVEQLDRAKRFVTSNFPNAYIVDEHATMISFEIPRDSIPRLSQAFSLLETHKAELRIIDYALSQSTLEQVFLKQIRPNDSDQHEMEDNQMRGRVPNIIDYIVGYVFLALAVFFPGIHQFWLGNTWRGLLYLFTYNEIGVGLLLDVFEMHIFIQRSVQEYGHTTFRSCFCCCCCFCSGSCGACCRCIASCLYRICCCCCICLCPSLCPVERNTNGGGPGYDMEANVGGSGRGAAAAAGGAASSRDNFTPTVVTVQPQQTQQQQQQPQFVGTGVVLGVVEPTGVNIQMKNL